MEAEIILEVRDLQTTFTTEEGVVNGCNGVSYSLKKGETLAVVGESGSGKSVTAMSTLRLIPEPPGKIVRGQILFNGTDLVKASDKEMRKIRGNQIAMIFQEPMTSLNPVLTVGQQIGESLQLHESNRTRLEIRQRVIEMLELVGIPSAEQRFNEFPHQLSGGMKQRVMIAMALACNPRILIADEPTSALDVTIQAQILKLIATLQQQMGMSVIMITHDLAVVAETADSVAVMYGGRIVEYGTVDEIFHQSRHPYLVGLKKSMPRLDIEQDELYTIEGMVPNPFICPKAALSAHVVPKRWSAADRTRLRSHFLTPIMPAAGSIATEKAMSDQIVLKVENLKVYFPVKKGLFKKTIGHVKAVDGISFDIKRGETFGLVGESGCGKTTAGKAIVRLEPTFAGKIHYKEEEITHLNDAEMRLHRATTQMIFQDPYSSLNPRMTIADIIGEPIRFHRPDADVMAEIVTYMEMAGLRREYMLRIRTNFRRPATAYRYRRHWPANRKSSC